MSLLQTWKSNILAHLTRFLPEVTGLANRDEIGVAIEGAMVTLDINQAQSLDFNYRTYLQRINYQVVLRLRTRDRDKRDFLYGQALNLIGFSPGLACKGLIFRSGKFGDVSEGVAATLLYEFIHDYYFVQEETTPCDIPLANLLLGAK